MIKNKQAEKLLLRVPRWVKKKDVRCEVDGTLVPIDWVGNYVLLTGLDAKAQIVLEFPMMETTETCRLAWRQDDFWMESTRPPASWEGVAPVEYTLQFRGNTLIDIKPRDRRPGIPLYADRSAERFRTKAPTHKVSRFVASVDHPDP